MPAEKLDFAGSFEEIDTGWSPVPVAKANGQLLELLRVDDASSWQIHEDTDRLFLVYSGRITVELRDEDDIVVDEGEFVVVPAGTEHRPVAESEAHVLSFEPDREGIEGDYDEAEVQRYMNTLDRDPQSGPGPKR